MNRRAFLKTVGKTVGAAALLPFLPHRLYAASQSVTPMAPLRRVRPSDAAWPAEAAWKKLNDAVGGNLIRVNFPLAAIKNDPDSAAAKRLWADLKNPYFIGDNPGLTETLGWVDAWTSEPSVYAVAARSASDIAAAVNFARDNNLRLVVKGGAHSYLGTSNAPDSLMIWTRHMTDIAIHPDFVPQGCASAFTPVPAVTLSPGNIWMQAYQAVTTQGGRYVQGGGCTTVGVVGLLQGGGFGSFSKHYGTAAGSLLEAEVVTADGRIQIANACTNPDLFWALKGGGGGTFGVISKLTVRTHDLPDYFGTANFKIKASSDDSFRRLVRKFVAHYKENLFNDHWGEQFHIHPDNTLEISMLSYGLDTDAANRAWQPFLEWVRHSPDGYSIGRPFIIASFPARRMWDVEWLKENWPEMAFPRNGNPLHAILDDILPHLMRQPIFQVDERPGAGPNNVWWDANTGECGFYLWAYESLWMPDSLLEPSSQARLADALFAASRYTEVALHCNKGLAGAPPEAIALARDTATNPAVLSAFALAIVGDAQQPAYPGIPGHEPSVEKARAAARRTDQCVNELRTLVPAPASYFNETNYFEKDWQRAFWGDNYARLAAIKKKYDPDGLFFVHNGVGSESWSRDGFTKT